jgi:hypothetical protein
MLSIGPRNMEAVDLCASWLKTVDEREYDPDNGIGLEYKVGSDEERDKLRDPFNSELEKERQTEADQKLSAEDCCKACAYPPPSNTAPTALAPEGSASKLSRMRRRLSDMFHKD